MIGVAGFTGSTWRDAATEVRHGEAALWKDAQQVAGRLAARVGERAAVAWVHTAAVVAHAAHYRLIEGADLADAAAIRKQAEHLAAAHPALAGFTDPDVNAMWTAEPTGAEAAAIGRLYTDHSVADLPTVPDGYLIGDLYQQLSAEARKGRALCQTPRWVSELLMDLSLDHAVTDAGWEGLPALTLIDPSCGTGHILVEALLRLEAWLWQDPEADRRPGVVPYAALGQVHGVDLDPYAALITRYRLCALAAAMAETSLTGLPADLPVNVAAADSLLSSGEPLLERGKYDVVIANPPYITPKDAKQNAAIRARYPQVCQGKYSLALPFHALMTELLKPGGWCAQLTANSFMKREFGKRYIEKFLAGLDLRWVIDTSGAYIPGHGTPTVILVNRNQAPASDRLAIVRGVRGEPLAPSTPGRGIVWDQIRRSVREHDHMLRIKDLLDHEGLLADGPGQRHAGVAKQPAPVRRSSARARPLSEQLGLFSKAPTPAARETGKDPPTPLNTAPG